MTQEGKELLIKDLCARHPYRVKISVDDDDLFIPTLKYIDGIVCHFYECAWTRYIDDIKPYLRPMSSMTDGEKEDLRQEHIKDEKLFSECLTKAANGDSSMRGKVVPHFAVDWCNKNHFDYRGLIPMGLALEAPEDMYVL